MASSGCESLGNSWNYLSSPTDGGSLESISSLSSLKSRRILTGRALPLKADGSPAASSLSYPGKIIIKGQRALSALPWSCSSLQSSTFGLSSSVPLIKHWGGAGRGQPWLPHLPPAQPSPAGSSPLLSKEWHCRCQAALPPTTQPWEIRPQTELTLLFLYFSRIVFLYF